MTKPKMFTPLSATGLYVVQFQHRTEVDKSKWEGYIPPWENSFNGAITSKQSEDEIAGKQWLHRISPADNAKKP